MPPSTAGSLLPPGASRQGPVDPGMSEQAAGEAISRYMDAVAEVTGDDKADIDLFDGGRTPDETASASSPTDEELERREAATRPAEPESDGEDADADEASTETEETEDSTQEDADAQAPSLEASQLAAMLGVDEEALVVTDDGALRLRYQVNGESGEATLQDVLASYQLQGHVNQKSEQLSEERRQMQAAIAEREQELQAAVQHAQSFQKVMEDRVLDKYSQVDWNRLKAEDPGRAALLNQEMLTEVQAIRAEAQRVEQAAMEQVQKAQQEQQQAFAGWLHQQQVELVKHLPDLADDTKRPEVLRGYQEYLLGYGFSPQEIQATHDHRFLRVIDDAVRYRDMLKANAGRKPKDDDTPVEKRLLKVPRVARGGSPQGESGGAQQRRTRAAAALNKSGSDEDAARFAVASGVADMVLGED